MLLVIYDIRYTFIFWVVSLFIEPCLKSCDICEDDQFDTTDAPTGDLLDIEFGTDPPTESSSVYPTLALLTDALTELPSAYPTIAPTTLQPTVIALLEVSEEPTSEVVLDIDFLSDKLEHEEEKEDESAAPTDSPSTTFTDAPTESPSEYLTVPPPVNEFGEGGI